MKLHLPKLLRKAVIACMTAVVSIGTTVGTGVVGMGVVTYMVAGATAAAAEYTNPDDLTAVTFTNGDVLNLSSGAKVEAPLVLDSADSSITLNVTGGTVTWNTSQGENNGVSAVNIATGATLEVGDVDSQYCVFASKQGAPVTISLATGAKMITSNLFGWENWGRGEGARVVNMEAGSEWTIRNGTSFYLNQTTINLSGGKIKLDGETSYMHFERRDNSINTTAAATQMSVISGTGAIKAGDSGSESAGYTFNVVRGAFEYDGTNTADLQLSARLLNANYAHGVQKTGNGRMEVTSDSTGFTHNFFVREGEMMFSGAGNIGSDNLNVISGASLTLNTSATFAGSITLNEGSVLNIGSNQKLAGNNRLFGTVNMVNTATLTGAVTVAETTIIDLTAWTGGSTYQLFTLDGGTVATSKVTVVGAEGEGVWVLDNTGLLSLKSSVIWSSGATLTWQEGTLFDGNMAFSNGMLVEFAASQGDVTATLGENISVPELTVKTGTNLVLTGDNKATVNSLILESSAGVVLDYAAADADSIGSVTAAADSTLAVGSNGDILWDKATFTGAVPNILVEGKLTVKNRTAFNNATLITVDGGELVYAYEGFDNEWSGNVVLDNGGKLSVVTGGSDLFKWNDANKVEVRNGSVLDFGTSRCSFQNVDELILKDGSVLGTGDGHGCLDFIDDGAIVSSSGTSSIEAPIRLRSAGTTTTFQVTDGTLTLTETCDKGNGASGNLAKTGTGTLLVTGNLSHKGTTTVSEGTLKLTGTAFIKATSDVMMGGGTLALDTQNAAALAGITGSGAVTVASTAVGAAIDTITNFGGTITVEDGGDLTIGAVSLAADKSLTVTGAVTAGNTFAKTGTGQLTLDVLNVQGTFKMNGYSALSVNSLSLALNTELVYGAGDVLEIGSVTQAVTLNVYGVASSLAEGVNTGISLAEGQSLDDLKALLTVDAVDAFTLVEKEGIVWLTSTSTVQSDWDINWGATLANAPTDLTELGQGAIVTKQVEGKTAADTIQGIDYAEGGVVAISVNATKADNELFVAGGMVGNIGGTVEAVSVDSVWIEVAGGTYTNILGGVVGNNWGGGTGVATFEGDTHILMREGTTDYVIGGNMNDANGVTSFTGDSYISVYEGATVKTAVVGGSTTAHGNGTKFTGSTHVFVYTCMDAGSYVVGGNFQIAGSPTTNILTGSTNVTVDLSSYSGDATAFAGAVIGGGLTYYQTTQGWSGGSMMQINKDTNVNITGKEGVTFTGVIVGGGYAMYYGGWGTCNPGALIKGSTNVNITGGTYDAAVMGGSYLAIGSNNTATSTIDSTNVNINGGTFNGMVLGGSWHNHEGGVSTVGDITISVSGTDASLAGNLIGASYVYTGGNTMTTGNVSINLEGGACSALITGGYLVDGTGSANLSATIGDISITVDGAETAEIYGGSVINRNKADATVTQGAIVLNLLSGSVGGDVYAGGWQNGSTLLSTDSTTVNISSDIEITEGKTISGGYRYGADKTGSTITGDATLAFTDGKTYSNVSGVTFADFNVVDVAENGSASVTEIGVLGTALTKKGAGTFTVTDKAVTVDAITMNGGTMNLAHGVTSATTGTGLTVKATTPSKLTLGKDLTLAALDIDLTGATAGESYIDVTGALTSNGKITVNLTGVSSLTNAGDYILLTSTSTALTTDDLTSTLDAEAPEGMEYSVVIENNNIIFRSVYVSDWVWEGTTDGETNVWADNANGWKADGDGLTPNGKDVYFTNVGAGEVVVSGVVTPANVNITGGEYTFTAADAGSGIKLGTDGVMSISAGVVVKMAMDNAELGGSTVLGGKLVLQSAAAVGNTELKFNGGTLVYDTVTDVQDNKIHISTDLSAQASLADDYTGPVKIEVTDAENSVTWGINAATSDDNSGVLAALNSGIEKTGEGALTLQVAHPNATDGVAEYAGAIDVQEGTLTINSVKKHASNNGVKYSGAVSVAGGTELHLDAAIQGDLNVVDLAGAISGEGKVSFGNTGRNYRISGDNSGFAGTLQLGANEGITSFADSVSAGGENTELELNGANFTVEGDGDKTIVSKLIVTDEKTSTLTRGDNTFFTGDVTGSGTFRVAGGIRAGMRGDLSAFDGTIQVDIEFAIMELGGEGVANAGGDIIATLAGNGTYKTIYTDEVVLAGAVTGAAKLQQSGAGKLILAAENTSTGTLTVDADKEVQLGAADAAGSWAGSELAGEGTFTLVHGALTGLTTKADTAKLVVETTTATVTTFAGGATGTVVDLRGSDATLVDSIKLVEGSTLIVDDALTVGGEGATTLDMSFTTDNVGASRIDLVAMIQGGDVTIAGTEGVNLNMTNADVLTALNNIGEGDLYLQVTDGKLDTAAGVDINDVIAPDLLGLGVRAQLTEESKAGGYVIINGDVSGVYFTDNQEGSSADTADTVTVTNSSLEIYAGVVINKDDTLSVGTSTTINNLNGQEGGNLVITDNSTVVLNNSQLETGVDGYDPMGATNVLAGNLTGEAGTTITVDGVGGKLTVGGDLTADALKVTAGDLVAAGGAEVDALTVSEGATMTVGTGKSLELKNGSIAGVLKADASGAELNTQKQVSVSGTISNMDMTVEDGSVVYLNNGEAYLNSLTVESGATVMGTKGLVDVGASAPSSIAGKLTGSGTLSTSAGTSLTFDNATGSADWNVTNKGDMTLDLTESGNLTLGALELANGSSTNVLFNSDNGTDGLLTLKGLTVGDTADITLSSTGSGQIAAGEYTLGTVEGTYDGADELTVNFSGTAFSQLDKVNSYIYVDDQGNIVLNAVKSENNPLAESATDPNAEAGAELLWNATAPVGGDLEAAYNAVNRMIAAGDAAGANEAMAAVAGASTAALGMAFAGDLERQLRAIRNRTTTMGVNQCVVNEGMPYVNAWVNAEGDRRSLDTDGVASGYELNSWGGTVGLDVDVNPNLTVGLALTAMYGNLTVDGPDTLEGDMDTYYVSAFARYSSGAWTHTFIGTIGMMDATTERTVNYGNGAYTAEGSTTGTAFGLMYEIGRVYALDDKGNTCLQPVFNVAYRHATVGSFEEENSDAGLRVDDQTVDTVTLGAGARLQTVVGENTFNRTSLLELRAMAKLDVGDTTSEADVALINGTGKGIIESAEMGAFGVELGMGLHIPVGDENDGTIFIDVSAEFRSGYTNINGTVGYRINF